MGLTWTCRSWQGARRRDFHEQTGDRLMAAFGVQVGASGDAEGGGGPGMERLFGMRKQEATEGVRAREERDDCCMSGT